MFYKLLFILKVVKLDLAVDVQRAMSSLSTGDHQLARDFFSKDVEKHINEPIFKKNFLNYLMSIGDYKRIIDQYPNLDPEITKKARELLIIINSKVVKDIAKLETISPNSVEVLKAIMRVKMAENDFAGAKHTANKILRSFKDNVDLMALTGQYHLLSGAYYVGINIFKEIGLVEIVNEINRLFVEYDNIKKEQSVNFKLKHLRSFYNKLNIKAQSDSFTPSVFTHIRLEILKEYLELAIANKKADASSLGKIYYVKMKDEYSRYLYIMSLIYDSNIPMAKKELGSSSFKHRDYETKIKLEIKRYENQNQEQKRHQQRQQQQRVPQQTSSKAGTDFLGYYKLLGVSPKASGKEIKKAYLKQIAKSKAGKKDPKDWEEKHIKLNKALEMLSNKKNREMYDKGIDPEKPQPEYEQFGGGGGFHFQGFEDFGTQFSDFFGGSGRSFRGGRRTQFVFL